MSIIGKIGDIDGKFYAISIDGSQRELKSGDSIFDGEKVVGDKNNKPYDSAVIDFDNGENSLIVLGDTEELIESALYSPQESSPEATEQPKDELASLLANEDDIDDIETAAGEGSSGAESTEGGPANFAEANGGITDINANLSGKGPSLASGPSLKYAGSTDTSADAGIVSISVIAADDIINATESGADTITVSGTAIGGDISTGDTVTVSLNGNDYTTTVTADGTYSVDVSTLDLLADNSVEVDVLSSDAVGNTVISEASRDITVDTVAPNIDELSITNIVDNAGDYSSVTMYGTGAEAGNTVTIYDEDGSAVATAVVLDDGTWNVDITSLSATSINDNEFFKATETDSSGNTTAQTDTTHYWHGNWSNASTENTDDFVMAGSGNDKIAVDDNDLNDKVVIDGGDGTDIATFGGDYADYTITTDANGYTIVTEGVSTDSDGDSTGDINELRNVETIVFADGSYDVVNEDFTENPPIVLLEESFENLQNNPGWHVETGDVTGDHGVVWDTGSNGLEVQSQIITDSSDGDTHAELDAHHNVTISTQVTLNNSEDYTLSFDFKPRDGGSGRDHYNTSDMKLTFGDSVLAVNSDNQGNLIFESNDDSIILRSELNTDTGWNRVVIEYTGITQDSLTLTIEGTGADDSYGALLDNIRIIDDIGENNDINITEIADAPTLTVEIGEAQAINNLIINGSFEDISGADSNGNTVSDSDISNNGWIAREYISGWNLMSDTSDWMEPHESGHAGIEASNGSNYLDLGESVHNSDSDNYNANTHIGQEVAGLIDGESYNLSFDYFDKAAKQESGANGDNSGALEVYFGGQLIATIDENNTTWQTFNITVEGGAGNASDILEFKEVGEGNDNWGMAIDNVALEPSVACVAYDLDITSSLVDTYGSESLSVTVGTLPDGANLSAGTKNADDTWTLNSDDMENLQVISPQDAGEFDITVSATSTDSSNLDISTTVTTTSGYDVLILDEISIPFDVLNNLSSIDALDLGKGVDNARSVALSLDDITGATDADNDLTIFGDEHDSVNLEDSDNWVKSDEESENGFHEYTSSEDPTVTLRIDEDIDVAY